MPPRRPEAWQALPRVASATPSRDTGSARSSACTQACILGYACDVLQANAPLDLASLREAYAGGLRPSQLVAAILERLARRGDDKVWIHRLQSGELQGRAAELERADAARLPRYGIPFP